MAKITKTCPICQKTAEESSHIILGKTRFITLKCNHTYAEKLVENVEIIPIAAATINPITPNKQKFETIAHDLMKYHGLGNRFNLHFDGRDDKILGSCHCDVTKDGIIVGS